MKLIVDSCVAVKWAFKEEFSGQALLLSNGNYDLMAPDFFLFEVSNVIWKKSLKEEMPLLDSLNVFNSIIDHFIEFIDTKQFLKQSISLAIQYQHPVYDCVYMVTALEFQIPLITADKRLFELGKKSLPPNQIHWIGNPIP